jgi:hypothetical protein
VQKKRIKLILVVVEIRKYQYRKLHPSKVRIYDMFLALTNINKEILS